MSPILINSTCNVAPPKNDNSNKNGNSSNSDVPDAEKGEEEEDTEKAREERKQTGRSIAIIIFLSLMCLALYHVIQRKTTILAGVLVPALILFAYTFFVIHISNRDKKRRKKMEAEELQRINELIKAEAAAKKSPDVPLLPIALAVVPSTSGKHAPSATQLQPQSKPLKASSKSSTDHPAKVAKAPNSKTNAAAGVKRKGSLKKIPPHSQVQVKSANQSAHIAIENEIKKLKKSRSFDKNNHLESSRHHLVVDNKKNQNKALTGINSKSERASE